MIRQKLLDPARVKGYVHWELEDETTGKIVKRGRGRVEGRYISLLPGVVTRFLRLGTENAIVDHARNQLATACIGSSVTFPQYVALGTGTTDVAASQTALATVNQYDGANDAKIANSRTLRGQYTSRIVAQFLTTEGNTTITELGLFEANDASQDMWARDRVNITKTPTERLNIYWYLVFERRTGLAIKSGASIGVTGVVTAATDSTMTFASAATIVIIENNAGEVVYIKLNEALNHGVSPTNYDFRMANGTRVELLNEEVEVSTVHVVKPTGHAMPHNSLSIRGW